jgi:parallel beta-helix repeat protein
MPTTLSQPGIYNALDTAYAGGMSPSYSAALNQAALQAAVNAAISGGGGIVLIPAEDDLIPQHHGAYQIQSTGGTGTAAVVIPSTAPPLLICGTGQGSTLLMENNGDVFDITGANNIAFQDLTIIYDQTNVSAPFTGTAISYMACQNCDLFRVDFTNCQQAVSFTENTAGIANTIAYMLDCFVLYDTDYPKQTCTGVQIAHAAETFITQCTFRSKILTANVESGQVGVSIGDSSYAHLLNLQIENFYTGIELGTGSGTAKGSMFTNVRVATVAAVAGQGVPVCLSINPNVYDARFIGCHFQNPPSPPNPTGQNIVINPASSGNSSIDSVIFDSCTSKTSVDYGLQIVGGQNIQILGGIYSGNTTAGIAITGNAADVQIIGVNCLGPSEGETAQLYGIYATAGSDIQIVASNCSGNGTSLNGVGIYLNGGSVVTNIADVRITGSVCNALAAGVTTAEQQYGIYVAGASGVVIDSCYASNNTSYGLYLGVVSNVTVSNCDLFGNSVIGLYINGGTTIGKQAQNVFVRSCNITGYSLANTISFNGNLTNVQVTDCAGYNDQGHLLTSSPPSTSPFSGVTYGYHGPVTFYVVGAPNAISINSNSTNLSLGTFTLGAGESASYGVGTPTHFLMIGN